MILFQISRIIVSRQKLVLKLYFVPSIPVRGLNLSYLISIATHKGVITECNISFPAIFMIKPGYKPNLYGSEPSFSFLFSCASDQT